MRTNVQTKQPQLKTHEGGPALRTDAEHELRRTILTCMLWEDTFYESGQSIGDRIADLVKQLPFDKVSEMAVQAREQMKLRHAPLLLLRELLRKSGTGRAMGDLIFRVIQRADEIGELLAIYWKEKAGAPLPYQMKLGLSRSLKKFNAFQLAKYDRETAVQLRDVAFLVHVRAGDAVRGKRIAQLVNKNFYPEATKAAHFPVKATYELGDYEPLETPDTWEVALSGGGDKRETFERLLAENKLGPLALLRNLRNMLQANVPVDAVRTAIVTMKTERVLPFRFITAARYAPQLEDALEVAMLRCMAEVEKLPGKTGILIDHSGSMEDKVSAKSEISRFDAACAMAIILRETCDVARVFAFSDYCVEVPPRRGFGLAAAVRAAGAFGGTMLGNAVQGVTAAFREMDRLVVITDEQSHDRVSVPRPGLKGYIINLGPYKNGVGFGSWTTVTGYSEATIDFIRALENDPLGSSEITSKAA
jgi:60 kDa SS-A/Ro ribonucleoprotein